MSSKRRSIDEEHCNSDTFSSFKKTKLEDGRAGKFCTNRPNKYVVSGKKSSMCNGSSTASKRKQTVPRRIPPGNKTAWRKLEDLKLQLSTELLIPKLSFARVVKEIAAKYMSDVGFQPLALQAFQEASEVYLVQFLQDSYRLCLHRNRCTLSITDMKCLQMITKMY